VLRSAAVLRKPSAALPDVPGNSVPLARGWALRLREEIVLSRAEIEEGLQHPRGMRAAET
jgi:hypothetical protein